jgi:hypothetical protein
MISAIETHKHSQKDADTSQEVFRTLAQQSIAAFLSIASI